jgi:DNA polymerase-3 subunit chi
VGGVPQIEFHTGVPDPQAFALRLLRKAWRSGATVLTVAPPAVVQALDRALWLQPERDFIPHTTVALAEPPVLRRSPLWLCTALGEAAAAAQAAAAQCPTVLVNVGADLAEPQDLLQALSPFSRLIEVVGQEPDAADAGRLRWRACRAAGLEVLHRPFDNGS